MSYTGPAITKDKAKSDVVNYLTSLGLKVEEVHRCTANIEYMDGYATYFYSHEISTVQALIKNFVDTHGLLLKSPRPKVYIWFKVEGTYRYLNVGIFVESEGGLTRLRKLVFGVPLH